MEDFFILQQDSFEDRSGEENLWRTHFSTRRFYDSSLDFYGIYFLFTIHIFNW